MARQKLTGGGIDLPGTFIAINSSSSAAENYTCYERETSFGEWKKVRGIVTATVTMSRLHTTRTADPDVLACKEEDLICKAEKIATDFMDETGINGMQLCVSVKNKIRWAANYGYADIENKIKVTDVTQFRINSISKSVTSLALLKLITEKKLDLDAPVQKYVPAFPPKPFPVTTRQLAGHLAGFRDYNENDMTDYIRYKHYETATAALEVFKDDTLLFQPGSKFGYSTFGWNLIGAVIEGITNESYTSYMTKNIWQPLQMTATAADDITRQFSNRSKFYDATGEENNLGDLSYKYAGGGLLSTATDLVKMCNELLHGSLFNAQLKSLLFESQITSDKKKTGYGLGWYTGTDKNGHRIWYHAGDSFSGSSYLVIYPDDDIVISFLANAQVGTNFDVQKIGELFYIK